MDRKLVILVVDTHHNNEDFERAEAIALDVEEVAYLECRNVQVLDSDEIEGGSKKVIKLVTDTALTNEQIEQFDSRIVLTDEQGSQTEYATRNKSVYASDPIKSRD